MPKPPSTVHIPEWFHKMCSHWLVVFDWIVLMLHFLPVWTNISVHWNRFQESGILLRQVISLVPMLSRHTLFATSWGKTLRDLTVFHVNSHQGCSIIKKYTTRKPHASQHRPHCWDFFCEANSWNDKRATYFPFHRCSAASSFGNNTG